MPKTTATKLVVSPERSRLMSRVRQRATSAELIVRRLLRSGKYRFSVNGQGLPGTPDIVNRAEYWAIFVHGCFWHAHANCKRWKIPKSNSSFWKKKFGANRRRDAKKSRELESKGYSILCVWECELNNAQKLKSKVFEFIADRRRAPRELHRLTSGGQAERRVTLPDGTAVTTKLSLMGKSRIGLPGDIFDYEFLRMDERPQITHHNPVNTVDLFCGCGGFSLGASEACRALGRQFVPVLAADMNTPSLNVYKANFKPIRTFDSDITELLSGTLGSPATDAEKELATSLPSIDLLLAGPPCQGHSNLNNHTRRDDARNDLYDRVARLVEIANPEHVLIENVPAVVHDARKSVERTIAVLRNMGYYVSADTIDLSILGVPQRRKRHLLIASRSVPLDPTAVLRKYSVGRPRTVKWAIGDIDNEAPNDIFHKASDLSSKNETRIRYLHRHHRFDLPNHMRPACHQNADHSYKSMYGRLRYSQPAQTITSGFGSPGQGRYIHPVKQRTLTPHEAARLQFFPDFFDFTSVEKTTELRQMIGNAVPMKLSYIFSLSLLGAAKKIPETQSPDFPRDPVALTEKVLTAH